MKRKMNTKNLLTVFLIIGFLFILFNSCKKDEDSNKPGPSVVVGEPVSDIDGNTYETVWIGEQNWMAENLKTTTYKDGTSINLVSDTIEWGNTSNGAYCWYDNNQTQFAESHGVLYNWYTVETGNLCPDGWHVPTDEEWTILENYIATDDHNGTEGTALKATFGWSNDTNGTDVYGFKALPGGGRDNGGVFNNIYMHGFWWSATESNNSNAWFRRMDSYNSKIYRTYYNKNYGFSVRCLRDN